MRDWPVQRLFAGWIGTTTSPCRGCIPASQEKADLASGVQEEAERPGPVVLVQDRGVPVVRLQEHFARILIGFLIPHFRIKKALLTILSYVSYIFSFLILIDGGKIDARESEFAPPDRAHGLFFRHETHCNLPFTWTVELYKNNSLPLAEQRFTIPYRHQ